MKTPSIAAFIYDFDGTLSPGNMQEYAFIEQLGIEPEQFWSCSERRAVEARGDNILAYMYEMVREAKHKGVKITRESFRGYGSRIEFFPGFIHWFERVNQYAKQKGVQLEHYIVSSGLREMIEGTPICRHFTKIYASGFMYDANGVADWPALAVNYTTKTQFLFRINKGELDEWDGNRINAYMAVSDRRISFRYMSYFGDGSTDIPCMRLVKEQGGYAVAVYRPGGEAKVAPLLSEKRVQFTAPADYSAGERLERLAFAMIDKWSAEMALEEAAG